MTTPDGKRTVLILDDSAVTLDLLRLALERAGFAVTTAINLASFERSAAMAPDLILIDVQMPEAYGDDVANVLRGLRNVTVPVLLFSIMDEAELADRAKAAEVDGYIHKGAGLDEMVRRVRALLDRAA